jgi:hypothetical protein
MSKAHRSKAAGRKRLSGERYPNGRLKPTAEALALKRPNPRVLAERRLLLGDAAATPTASRLAENPLDCMGARGWIAPDLVRAGHAYAGLHRRAGLRQARVTPIAEETREGSGVDKTSIAEMTPEEIVQVWAAVERRREDDGGGEGDPDAAATLKAMWRALGPVACAELHSVCLAQSWPFWAMQKVCGRAEAEIAEKWLRRRAVLVRGLTVVRDHLKPRRAAPSLRAPDPEPVALLSEETVCYVDEVGRPDPVRNSRGFEVEVVRRRRINPPRL